MVKDTTVNDGDNNLCWEAVRFKAVAVNNTDIWGTSIYQMILLILKK
jgi:hypothetical protein